MIHGLSVVSESDTGVKIYAFLTVGENALTGVCAHEIGHLGKRDFTPVFSSVLT